MDNEKKIWTTPELVVYGTVEEITGKAICKTFGSGDDLCSMISQTTGC
jgi:hypothetical protein